MVGIIIIIIYFMILFNEQNVKANMFIYGGCSQDKYEGNSPYEISLNFLLSSMVTSASQALYNSFALGNNNDTSQSFGFYQCRGDLDIKDCSSCISTLVGQIELVCPYAYGGSMQLEVCYVRYEHVDFLGKLDTSLRYKKCSTRISKDVEFLKRRDDVLVDLQAATTGFFRVSSSGSVQGYAQCYGDLIAAADCSYCLSDAILKLKNLCESTVAAEVFLAQCYARYWASGYYYGTSGSYKHDDVGKTVAIIVGVVVGLSIIIVLLSVCRNAAAVK